MTKSHPAVIPFPKRIEPLECTISAVCHFQAAAELRMTMLHKLFDILARTDVATDNAGHLHDCCNNARELLNDAQVLYRSALAQGRVADD